MKNILYILLAVATLVGCQSDVDALNNVYSTTNSLSVSLPSESEATRVSLTDKDASTIALAWDSDDTFTIYTAAGDRVEDFTFDSASGDNSYIFTATDGTLSLTSGVDYIAIYPAVEDVTNLEDHRAAILDLIDEQTQVGDSDNSHLSDALQMEAAFTYSSSSVVSFEHKVATISISFSVAEGNTPSYVTFYDGDLASYILNFDGASQATSSTIYTASFVINTNNEGVNRDLTLVISAEGSSANQLYSQESDKQFEAGVQYRSDIASESLPELYFIYKEADLIALRDSVSNSAAVQNAMLMNDIELTEDWTPIGSESTPFTGSFDGCGYTIEGLKISSTDNCVGLFGYVDGGSIKNLTLNAPDITKTTASSGGRPTSGGSSSSGATATGAICGYIKGGSIENCSVESGTVSGTYNVGGVAGYTDASTIAECYNTASVSGSYYNIGGIVGEAANYSTLTACYNSGDITGDYYYIGGLVGYCNPASLYACYNVAEVGGTSGGIGSLIGGMTIESSPSYVMGCYSNTNFMIIGSVYDEYSYDNLTVEDCYYISPNSYTYGTNILNLAALNAVVDNMNSAAGGNYYTQNASPYLPSLFSEKTEYQDITYNESVTIASLDDLIEFRELVNSGWGPKSATLTASTIDLSSINDWTPIGSESTPFTGTFDGGSNTITGLTIDNDESYTGLFGYVNGGSIKNLTLQDVNIEGHIVCVGAICGYMDGGSIESCSVESGTVSGYYYVGGVVGYICCYENSSKVTNCYNKADINGGDFCVGGVVGYIGLSNNSSSEVSDCYNTGTISEVGKYVGGVVGYLYLDSDCTTEITECYNTGSISASSYNVGGLVGAIELYSDCTSEITDCYNTGNISASSYSVSGVVGAIELESNCISEIAECYNTGEITSEDSYVGGVVGAIDYKNSDYMIIECYNTAAVTGVSHIGGIVGDSWRSNSSGYEYDSYITACYNSGKVKGSSTIIGGIIGRQTNFLDDLYLNITACYNSAEVEGTSFIGGIVGTSDYTKFTACYNRGDVTVTGDSTLFGGVSGYNNSYSCTATECYYLDSSITGTPGNYGKLGTSASNDTMIAATFVTTLNTATDVNYWAADTSAVNSGYPILSSLNYELGVRN